MKPTIFSKIVYWNLNLCLWYGCSFLASVTTAGGSHAAVVTGCCLQVLLLIVLESNAALQLQRVIACRCCGVGPLHSIFSMLQLIAVVLRFTGGHCSALLHTRTMGFIWSFWICSWITKISNFWIVLFEILIKLSALFLPTNKLGMTDCDGFDL